MLCNGGDILEGHQSRWDEKDIQGYVIALKRKQWTANDRDEVWKKAHGILDVLMEDLRELGP